MNYYEIKMNDSHLWNKCIRDDAVGNQAGRMSFMVLSGIFSLFFLYGLFVSYSLFKTKSIKHSALYVFYALGLLTLLSKYIILIKLNFLFLVRVLFFLDPLGNNLVNPES